MKTPYSFRNQKIVHLTQTNRLLHQSIDIVNINNAIKTELPLNRYSSFHASSKFETIIFIF